MIHLKEIKITQLHVFMKVLNEYQKFLDTLVKDFNTATDTRIRKSINNEMILVLKLKLNKRFRPLNSTIKMEYHKAVVFLSAIIYYLKKELSSDEKELLEKYQLQLLATLNNDT